MDAWRSRRGPAQSEAILVVDDEEVVRRVVRQALEADGYRVLEAEDGVEALEVLMRRDPRVSLVLTDGTMPGMDGWELLRIIGAVLPGLPTILMTGWAVDPAEKQPASPTAVLEKPFTQATLAKRVRSVLASGGRV
jgi:two-component system, cell cycle sensor histidine kinase and response regulator CckA